MRSSRCVSWNGQRVSNCKCLKLVSSRPACSRRSTSPSPTPSRPARLRPLQRPTSLPPTRFSPSATQRLAAVSGVQLCHLSHDEICQKHINFESLGNYKEEREGTYIIYFFILPFFLPNLWKLRLRRFQVVIHTPLSRRLVFC